MDKKQKQELMALLVGIQEDCVPITLSIGRVDEDNIVDSGCIVIKDCPPRVINMLVEKKYLMEMRDCGLNIWREG